jgi:hypothetical protein
MMMAKLVVLRVVRNAVKCKISFAARGAVTTGKLATSRVQNAEDKSE